MVKYIVHYLFINILRQHRVLTIGKSSSFFSIPHFEFYFIRKVPICQLTFGYYYCELTVRYMVKIIDCGL